MASGKGCPVPTTPHCCSPRAGPPEPRPLGDFGREKGSAGRALQGQRGAESAPSGSLECSAPPCPLPLTAALQQQQQECIPGTLGLPHPHTAPPWIFRAARCQELITACAAAASSPLYIISALALLLLCRSHLLTPDHPRVIVPLVPAPGRAWRVLVALLAPLARHQNSQTRSEQGK